MRIRQIWGQIIRKEVWLIAGCYVWEKGVVLLRTRFSGYFSPVSFPAGRSKILRPIVNCGAVDLNDVQAVHGSILSAAGVGIRSPDIADGLGVQCRNILGVFVSDATTRTDEAGKPK